MRHEEMDYWDILKFEFPLRHPKKDLRRQC